MREKADLEHYLLQLGQPYEEISEGIFMIRDEIDHVENIVVIWAPPLVIFRVKLIELPAGDNHGLLQHLLELNATDMVGGAFGLEGNSIVVVDTLQTENLDFNEFQASIDSLVMAITVHHPQLSKQLAKQSV